MEIYLKEKIGNPDLFTGRRNEIDSLLTWVEGIKKEQSRSRAILSRRKTGKTALLQRFYNILFDMNDRVVPFYYEIPEINQWVVQFCEDYFLAFIYQYIAFKTRKKLYIESGEMSLENAVLVSQKEGLDYLVGFIKNVAARKKEEDVDIMWSIVRDAPRRVAAINDERIVQIIDEFQFLNRFIYRDKSIKNCINEFAGSYLHTAEYKNAPLLVSGSWIGWLICDLNSMLPARFIMEDLLKLPGEEALEMILKYSLFENVPITEEIAGLMVGLTEGNPFYITLLFQSTFPDKDFTSEDGLLKTLEFETSTKKGSIYNSWMEYINAALPRVNDRNAKKIVMYLCKHRDREVSRKELLEQLPLDLPDDELSKRLEALAYSDIIEYGRSNFYYRGVPDNIFDKVFRSRYADDIQEFDPLDIKNEYKVLITEERKKYKKLAGEFSYYKGLFAEFTIINVLMYRAYKNNDTYISIIENLPADFSFSQYQSVWSYKASPAYKRDIQIDVWARADEDEYSLICEVKNRLNKKFSKKEAEEFMDKARILSDLEEVNRAVLMVFSRSGFSKDAVFFMKKNNIAWSGDQKWFDSLTG